MDRSVFEAQLHSYRRDRNLLYGIASVRDNLAVPVFLGCPPPISLDTLPSSGQIGWLLTLLAERSSHPFRVIHHRETTVSEIRNSCHCFDLKCDSDVGNADVFTPQIQRAHLKASFRVLSPALTILPADIIPSCSRNQGKRRRTLWLHPLITFFQSIVRKRLVVACRVVVA